MADGDGRRVGPQRVAGNPQSRGFLLHTARVGEDRTRPDLQRQELEISERLQRWTPGRLAREPRSASRALVRGCTGNITGARPCSSERIDDSAQRSVIDVSRR